MAATVLLIRLPLSMSRAGHSPSAVVGKSLTFNLRADPADLRVELTSYEWNFWLNDAPYSEPQWAPIYTNEAVVIVNKLFGGRSETPISGDADCLHNPGGVWMGKNALYFDGRVQRVRFPQ